MGVQWKGRDLGSLFEKEIMTEEPRNLCLLILCLNFCKGVKNCWAGQNIQKHVGTISCGIKDKHVCKNNINFNRMQLGRRSAVNSDPADSCCYLEPDVLILGLDQGRSIMRCREQCDDGESNVMMDWRRLRAILRNLDYNETWVACYSEYIQESDQWRSELGRQWEIRVWRQARKMWKRKGGKIGHLPFSQKRRRVLSRSWLSLLRDSNL